MVDVDSIKAHEIVRARIPPDAAVELLEELVNMGLRPRMYFYVGPKLTSSVQLTNGETLNVDGRPTLIVHEFMTSFRTLRRQAMDASAVYAGPPGYEKVAEEAFECLVVVPTD